jgi:hypothetical protein
VPNWAGGLRYNGHWFCSRACVEHAARAGFERPAMVPPLPSTLPPLRLGVLLRHAGAVDEAGLKAGLDAQRASGRRLGDELRRLRIVDPGLVLRALATQGGVRYLTAFDVTHVPRRAQGGAGDLESGEPSGPAWLPADTVRALGLIPFEADDVNQRLKVVCAAPLPRVAIRALLQLTGWTAEPFLVHDDVYEQALRMYRADEAGTTTTVGTVAAAAACVADAAQAERSITVRSAACDRYTWVRIEGARQTSDLLVPSEELCLAAPTAR